MAVPEFISGERPSDTLLEGSAAAAGGALGLLFIAMLGLELMESISTGGK